MLTFIGYFSGSVENKSDDKRERAKSPEEGSRKEAKKLRINENVQVHVFKSESSSNAKTDIESQKLSTEITDTNCEGGNKENAPSNTVPSSDYGKEKDNKRPQKKYPMLFVSSEGVCTKLS